MDNEVSWTTYDFSPAYYNISIDGVFFKTGQWNSSGESIIVNLDHLGAGTHNITVLAVDLAGNSVADTVIVTIGEATTSTSTTTNNQIPTEIMILGTVLVTGVIVVVLFIVRSKR